MESIKEEEYRELQEDKRLMEAAACSESLVDIIKSAGIGFSIFCVITAIITLWGVNKIYGEEGVKFEPSAYKIKTTVASIKHGGI